EFERRLEAVYDLRKLGELKWFLGIRVLRDWTAGKIWLTQDSFIEKVVNKYDLDQKSGGRYPAVPLVENSLAQSTEDTSNQRTQLYQQLVGSLAYISTFTRPDVARAHSVLARHLQNPGQKHVSAVKHVWRYL
ncbi:Pol-like protein, partial [Pyrenophora tritici-repentis]